MNFNAPKTLNEFIIHYVQKGPVQALGLIELIKEKRPGTTKQGVYAALRALKKEEVVVIHGGLVSLNSVWVSAMAEYFSLAQHSYAAETTVMDGFLNLKDGEKIQYFFRDPTSTDAFWSHLFNILVETTPSKEPIYLYNPHDWFLLAREENELTLLQTVAKRGKPYFMTVSSHDFLDTYIRKYFDNALAQYYLSPKKLFVKGNYYLNIFGDFLIEVWIDKHTAHAIDTFYKTTKQFTEKERQSLQKIISQKGRSKIMISRNNKKAERLKKYFKKFFYIPKSL